MLISGTGAGIDVEDMRANVQYAGGYHEEHPLVLNFWKACADLPHRLCAKHHHWPQQDTHALTQRILCYYTNPTATV